MLSQAWEQSVSRYITDSDLRQASVAESPRLCSHAISSGVGGRNKPPRRTTNSASELHVEVTHRFQAPNRYGWELRPAAGLSAEESRVHFPSWEEASQAGKLVRENTTSAQKVTTVPYWPRMEDKLTAHKFKIGESVDYIFAGRHGAVGVYEVTQLMPVKDDQLQYRIKSANEPHERMVKESELDRKM